MRQGFLLFTFFSLLSISVSNSIFAQCTIPPAPTNVTATPDTFCLGSIVQLNATTSGTGINWYTVPTGGVPIGSSLSGANFNVTPPGTTTYYAEAVDGSSGSQTFSYTGSIQTFTVPAGVTTIAIDAKGAQGGGSSGGTAGGLGARMVGTYTVTPGQVLYIVVGQMGLLQVGGQAQNSSGGGGGTFVYDGGPTLLVAAGGGGGKCNYTGSVPLHAGAAGQITTAGGPSSDGNAGGVGGNGGNQGLWGGTPCAGGGAGWLTNGGGPYGGISYNTWTGGPGYCGGGGGGCGGVGGFGGGGGGGNLYGGGGGGGGYSGGGGGTDPTHGGGGGSYSIGSSQANTAGYQSGDGEVIITWTATICYSLTRTPVTVTVGSLSAPTNVTATPDTFCLGSTVQLNATSTGGGINWYTVPTGGVAIGSSLSGANFTVTPPGTTTYYAEAVSGSSGSQSFTYTGSVQTFNVPAGVFSIDVDITGGSGGTGTTGTGGLGGRVQSTLSVTPGQTLQIYVGGAGGNLNNVAGYNGGANTPGTIYPNNVGGGGGASDIRVSPYGLNDRIIVAGGGGGGGYNGCTENGGAGGGLVGAAAALGCGSSAPGGGSQVGGGAGGTYSGYSAASPGTFGLGGQGATGTSGTGGGGGYYGGGGGSWQGGGGGSSYSNGAGTIHTQGFQSGNGTVALTWTGTNCSSNTRVPVTVTVGTISAPINVTATPDTFCVGSTVLLSATSTGGAINWYTVPTGGVLLGTSVSGANFAVIPPGTTTYYAESSNGVGAGGSQTFTYTGGVQTFTVPAGVTSLTVDVMGAQGGASTTPSVGPGGNGGRVQGTVNVTPGQILNVYVGGQGAAGSTSVAAAGGYNGGGNSAVYVGSYGGGGGGGASDVRTPPYTLADRIVVAGGGGGGAYNYASPGYDRGGMGGGLVGETGYSGNVMGGNGYPGTGGTQVGGGIAGNYPGYCIAFDGALGIGGAGGPCNNSGGGGGGGYYGGGGGVWSGGGGGSNYLSGGTHTQGFQAGNGQVTLSWTGAATCVSATRVPVTVTVGTLPAATNVTATPDTFCLGSTVQLNATSSGGGIDWYDAPTGGTLLGSSLSGANFAIAPPGTFTYYAEATNGAGPGGTQTFSYTGSLQTFTVPVGVTTITIDAYGAEGIGMNGFTPGQGGRATGDLTVTPGQVLNIYVGGQALFNGGGAGKGGANGGDASDVRVGGTALANRVIVAGGGGGAGGDNWSCFTGNGDGGGGTAVGANFVGGGGGSGYSFCGGNGGNTGGTSSTATHGGGGGGGGMVSGGAGAASSIGTALTGALGQGGDAYMSAGCSATGGGGGGYYGGGGAAGNNCGAGQGGGGSSWTGTLANPSFAAGVRNGSGQVTLTWTGSAICTSPTRVPVTVTLGNIAAPTSVTATPSTFCPGMTVQLNAISVGDVNWYTVPTGGTLIGTSLSGANFAVTPPGTTTYYAEAATNGGGVGGTQTFNYTGSIQTFTVPAGVTSLTINAKGAQGGAGGSATIGTGGLGANMTGTFTVTPGQIIKILVGQQGGGSAGTPGAGGGGGTYVTDNSNNPIIIAGGGGGRHGTLTAINIDANTGNSGFDGYSTIAGYPTLYGIGGINGNGATNNGACSGNAGGLLTNGSANNGCCNTQFGYSFLNLGVGGTSCTGNIDIGGYGGGGGGGNNGSGGGGGYSGGGGSYHTPTNGGGGGSFNNGTNQSNLVNNTGNGQVVITYGGAGCVSPTRTPVTVTASGIPAPTTVTATPNPFCPGSTVQLNGTASVGDIDWYTVPAGGVSIGSSLSGANFAVTPAGTTTYYAEAVSGGGASGTQTFSYTGALQNFTVPVGVTSVTITAKGAQGGAGGTAPAGSGGLGANMTGTFTVTPGQVLKVLVGQQGSGTNVSNGASGGGGTYVTDNSNNPLVIAGGGGGVHGTLATIGKDANVTTNGNDGYSAPAGYPTSYGVGGINGNGATNGPSQPHAGNGGGLLTAGAVGLCGGPGQSFVSGGAGGTACITYAGGFGGGGGDGNNGGGGGGGYSGGGGSYHTPTNGGGGGSYNGGTSQVNLVNQVGNGEVVITYGSVNCVSSTRTPVTVTIDNLPPTLTWGGGTQTLNLGLSCDVSLPDYTTSPFVSTNDNCTAFPTVTQSPPAGTLLTAVGSTTITLTATDAIGNAISINFTVNTVDPIPPTIAWTGGNQSLNLGVGCSVAVPDYTTSPFMVASDNCGSPIITQSPIAGAIISSATNTTILLTATDASGNIDTVSFVLTTVGVSNPSISWTGGGQTLTLSGSCDVSLPDYTTSPFVNSVNSCSGPSVITQSPAPATLLNGVGNTTVTLTATDPSGNFDTTSFIVTTVDVTAPTIAWTGGAQTLNLDGSCSAVMPDYTTSPSLTVSDNCGAPTITQSPAIGTVFSGLSINTVTLTATDASGNSTSTTFTLNVVDVSIPIITWTGGNQSLNLGAGCQVALPDYTTSPSVVASDNCNTPVITQVPAAGTILNGVSNTMITLTATDASGNTDTATFVVTTVGITNPVISWTGGAQTLTLSGVCDAILPDYTSSPFVNVTNSCSGVPVITQSPAPTTVINGVTTTIVTLTATDPGGNTDTATFVVNTVDVSIPTIAWTGGAQTLNLDGSCAAVMPDYTSSPSVTATDNCGIPTITQSPAIGSALSGVGSTTVTLTATDASGNTATTTFTVNTVDVTGPTITWTGGTQPLNLGVGCQVALPDYTSSVSVTVSDNCAAPTVSQSPVAGTILNGISTTTVTLTATDASGNTSSTSFIVNTVNVSTPGISWTGGAQTLMLSAICDTILPDYTTSPFVAVTNSCAGIPVVTQSPAAGSILNGVGANTITLTATDTAGNFATTTFTVNTMDMTNPMIAWSGGAQTLNLDASCATVMPDYTNSASITAADNCNTPTITQSPAIGSALSGVGITTVTLTATDASGNTATTTFAVNTVDVTAPVITWTGGTQSLNLGAGCNVALPDYTTSPSAVATDNCSAPTITQSPIVGTVLNGVTSVTVTLTATDASGNTNTTTFVVNSVNVTTPGISWTGGAQTLNLGASCTATLPDYTSSPFVTVTNSCAGTPVVTQSPAPATILNGVGSTTVTLTATDTIGNFATTTFTVNTVDVTNPTIAWTGGSQSINLNASCSAVMPNYTGSGSVTAADNCSVPTITQSPAAGSALNGVSANTVTLTATDASGNTATTTFVLNTLDVTNPTVTAPANMTVNNDFGICGAVVTFNITANDNCSGAVASSSPASGSSFPIGTTIVTATATDGSGNIATSTFTVTVVDVEGPTINNIPPNISVINNTGTCGAVVTWAPPLVLDNCPGTTTLTTSIPSGSTFNVGTTTVNLTATDASGFITNASFTVTVVDNESPALTVPSTQTINLDSLCNATVPDLVALSTATDNCPGVSMIQSPLAGTTISGNSPVTVMISATDASNNTLSQPVTLMPVLYTPNISAAGPTTFCDGNSVDLMAPFNGTYSYQWYQDGILMAGETNSSLHATAAGTYTVEISVVGSCTMSSTSIPVSVTAVNVGVTQNGSSLSANATGATYQWIDCSDNSPIPGATSQNFNPADNGNFAVVVSQNGCKDTSACFSVTTLGIVSGELGSQIRTYPNPTTDMVNIDLGEEYPSVEVEIYSIIGSFISKERYTNAQLLQIQMPDTKGVYLVKLSLPSHESATVRVIKE